MLTLHISEFDLGLYVQEDDLWHRPAFTQLFIFFHFHPLFLERSMGCREAGNRNTEW